MDSPTIRKVRNQIKSKWYYVFWGVCSVSVVSMCGMIAHSNYALASSRDNMAESIREYVLIKPFPLLCRDGTYLGG